MTGPSSFDSAQDDFVVEKEFVFRIIAVDQVYHF